MDKKARTGFAVKILFVAACGLMAAVTAATFLLVPVWQNAARNGFDKRIAESRGELQELSAREGLTITALDGSKSPAKAPSELSRDPFVEFVKAAPPLPAAAAAPADEQRIQKKDGSYLAVKLISIGFAPLPIIYKGYVDMPDGTITAQVNFDKVTFFAKKDALIHGWRVVEIDKKNLRMASPDNKEIVFDYNKTVPGNDRLAMIKNLTTEEIISAKRGQQVDGYVIEEISEQAVKISFAGKTIDLKLER